MKTLILAAKQLELERTINKTVKSKTELGISASGIERWITSDEFYKIKVPVNKLPLLYGDVFAGAEKVAGAVIIDYNVNKINKAAGGYIPKVVIIAGAEMVADAKRAGVKLLDCWVGKRAARSLKLPFQKPLDVSAFATTSVTPGFNPNPASVPSSTGGIGAMPSATFGDMRNFGPPGSQLNHPEWSFMSMQNIQEALSMYLADLKDGIWKPISSQWAMVPPSLVNATNEAGVIAKEKGMQAFAPMDFVLWQKQQLEARHKTKRVNGKSLSCSKFKHVDDPDDPSTWSDLK